MMIELAFLCQTIPLKTLISLSPCLLKDACNGIYV